MGQNAKTEASRPLKNMPSHVPAPAMLATGAPACVIRPVCWRARLDPLLRKGLDPERGGPRSTL